MRKVVLLLTMLMGFSFLAFSQTRVITGTVTDESGKAIPFATIAEKGAAHAVAANEAGVFSIQIKNGATLSVSATGFVSQEVPSPGSPLAVVLKTASQTIEEVVVTAYGATKRKAFTGTASVINSDKFKDMQVSSLTNVLQGQASGVLAVSGSGQPGENATIRIRGIGSLSASSDPLILLDGAPYAGNINSINPNDIESITVLKDASSTALYGSRAANGILQITTKQGNGPTKIDASFLYGFSSRAVPDYKYLSTGQIYETTWLALKNEADLNPTLITQAGVTSAAAYASKTVAGLIAYNPYRMAQPVGLDGKIVPGASLLWNEDWSKQLLRVGHRKQADLSISGGTDKTKYFISGQYLDDPGLVVSSFFKRYSTRIKVDTKISSWLKAGLNTNVSYSNQSYPAQGGSAYSNSIQWIRSASSIFPAYLVDTATGSYILDAKGNKILDYGNNGQQTRPYGAGSNALGAVTLNQTSYDRFITSLNGYAEAHLLPGLDFRTQYVIDYYLYSANQYYNPFLGDGAAYKGRSYKERDVTSSQTFTNTLTYDKSLDKANHINVVLGMEAYRWNNGNVAAENRGFTFPDVTELDYGSNPITASSWSYNNRMVSYFGRLNYDVFDRYHLSLSARTDASTRFADSVRWGKFYSAGFAWNINRESFFHSDVVSDLKLRVSYGTTGNSATSSFFPYLGLYDAGWNIADFSGSVISSVTNGLLSWEKQKTLDLGLDFGFWNNRITGSFTYFDRVSDGLLFAKPLPPSSGVSSVTSNIAKVSNKGYEVDFNTRNISNGDFLWTTSLNFTTIKNKVLELPNHKDVAGSGLSMLSEGKSVYNYYIREYAGVDMADGRPMWYKDVLDGDGKVTGKDITKTYSEATRYFKGSSLPAWSGGISNYVRYKDIDLSFLISVSHGGKVYDYNYAALMHGGIGTSVGQNWSPDILNSWKSPSDPGDGITPKLMQTTDYQPTSVSTRFLYDGSFARVRNVTMGYNIPKKIIERYKINRVRFYVDMQNPLTFFGRKGFDPEEGGLNGASANNNSAVYKSISFGVNVNL
ncbi:SusC/RagA family TonB-linked outer membrane protein [Niabella drilacis]|uniref:TonB-linked outer membrane protein, SusC/RagA family n=1 Tax=Niabella drilacis (strain DSM 25811 / CCM 8410 / CCUG 62505 / LMG 26954 / E90) TaxID=1285928 RepID=A0A1G6KXL9_NIADE|nr:TonB-dependent receptor [Niabella drilacis]SDC35724.1 TonB-linked outer membrane protein, SusC/RagA family [Niabella drilacis]